MSKLKNLVELLIVGVLSGVAVNILKLFIQSKIILLIVGLILVVPITYLTLKITDKLWKTK